MTSATSPLPGTPAEGDPAFSDPRFVGPVYATPTPPARPGLFARLAARAPRWSGPVAVAACFAGVASWVWVSDPTDSSASDMPTCLVKLTTGLDCPGCGGTRAFYYLLHANLPQAVRHHAIAVLAAPVLVWLYLAWAVRTMTGRRLPMPRLGPQAVLGFLVAWAVFTVVRNIPIAPFTALYV